jgi:hypothetical protein
MLQLTQKAQFALTLRSKKIWLCKDQHQKLRMEVTVMRKKVLIIY